jgi:hypothetical protein
MIRKSLLTSQMSLFFPTQNHKTKKIKMKEALHTGVKALINATLPTPRLFNLESQNSFSDHASQAPTIESELSSAPKQEKNKSKFRKLFGALTGRTKSKEETRALKPRTSSISSDPSEKNGRANSFSVDESQPPEENSSFRWGKEKTIVRSALGHSPAELFEKHLTLEEEQRSQDPYHPPATHQPHIGLRQSLNFRFCLTLS